MSGTKVTLRTYKCAGDYAVAPSQQPSLEQCVLSAHALQLDFQVSEPPLEPHGVTPQFFSCIDMSLRYTRAKRSVLAELLRSCSALPFWLSGTYLLGS